MTRKSGIGFVVINTAMLWSATAIAAIVIWPIYLSAELPILVAVTVVVGSAVAILGAVYRWSSLTVMLISVAVFLVIGVPLAVPTKAQFGWLPTPGGLWDLIAGVALGWKQLLTVSLPVGRYEALLVPPLVMVLATTVVGLTIALRTRFGEFAVFAPIALFITAIAFGPDYPIWPIEISLGLLATILLWLIFFRWHRHRSAIRLLAARQADVGGAPIRATSDHGFIGARSLFGAVVIVAIAAGAAVAATAALPPNTSRTVLRTTIEQPFDPREYVSPLSAFRRYWQPATVDSVLFTVNGLAEGGRIRIATLDSYDGIVYSVGSSQSASESGSFTRVPYRFDQSDLDGTEVAMTVLVGTYSDVWLPTVGQFESITFTGARAEELRAAFYYNDTSGTAAVIGGLVAGDSYTLTSIVPSEPSAAELSSLTPGPATVPAPNDVPDEVATALDRYLRGLDSQGSVDGAGAGLVAMLDGLRTDGYISHGVSDNEPPSRSGHAADRIGQLFTEQRMIGDAEQYAVTAALMARELGFPARVVFGFVPDGVLVRGGDVSAWIEVNTAQYGWVTIDPTPEQRPIPDELPEDPARIARPQTIVPPPNVESETFDRQPTPDIQKDQPSDLDPLLAFLFATLRVAGWAVLVLSILLSPFVVVIAAKFRRRRLRRRASTVIDQISGGWQEFEDAVVDHGLTPPPAATRSEVSRTVGTSQSRLLAAVADRAIFSPGKPPPGEVDAVWRAVEELRASLDHGLTRWQRIKAKISLRSLGGYSVRKLFKR